MRLLSLYVKSFGKLRDFSYEFTEGFNEIKEDNGFGKTTLAAFIKAMFYGYANNKKTDIDQNDFKHYRPFNTTVKFGGCVSNTRVVLFAWKDISEIRKKSILWNCSTRARGKKPT